MSNLGSDLDALDAFVAGECFGKQWRPRYITHGWSYLRNRQGVESVPAYIDTNGLNAGFHRLWYRSNYQGLYYCEVVAPDGEERDRYFVWYNWGQLAEGAEVIIILDAADYRDWLARQGFN